MSSKIPIHTKVVIIGAGFGGLGMGIALKKAGEDAFMILEQGHDVGGVWRENTYPGCTCDVPSHLYSFSFAPYRKRDKRYPPQTEILDYLRDVADDYGLRPHLRLNTRVSEARFHQDKNIWNVVTASGQHICAEVVIFAVGQLHEPSMPDIKGLEDFNGPVFHTARWQDDVKLVGKKISVIGTGSSAAQMLPSLASLASKVTVYQRNAHWVLPKPDTDFGRVSKFMLRVPGAHRVYREGLEHCADKLLSPIPRSKAWRQIVECFARYHLHHQVSDDELVKKLTPTYPIGSKRILMDSGFYAALGEENVELITEPIEEVEHDGIKTLKGTIEADIIICATGFQASKFLVPIAVRGRDGRSLNDDWSAGAEAFLGLAVHGYPNLFMIAGPNTFNPAGSNPGMKELQIEYIMRCLSWKKKVGAQTVEVDRLASSEYQHWLRRKLNQTVWPDSVDSWYKHESGKITNPWPSSVRVFTRMLRRHPERSFLCSTPNPPSGDITR